MNDQLKVLSIFQYIYGGLQALFSCLGFIHFFIGLSIITDPIAWQNTQDPPPEWFGWLFLCIGLGVVLIGWLFACFTIMSGRFIAKRKNRVFCIVIGAINCLAVPLGTVLGVFTIVLLTRDEAKKQFESNRTV